MSLPNNDPSEGSRVKLPNRYEIPKAIPGLALDRYFGSKQPTNQKLEADLVIPLERFGG